MGKQQKWHPHRQRSKEQELGRPHPELGAREEFALSISAECVHSGIGTDGCEMTNQPNLSHQGGIRNVHIM